MPSNSSSIRGKLLTLNTINPNVLKAQYAVRGELAIRAEQLRNLLVTNKASLPFTKIINCNIGNPQQLNQPPITYLRQIASLLEYPALLDPCNESKVASLYPIDAIQRARALSSDVGSVGAYSHSQGILAIRQSVADFIHQRDGFKADPENIFLTAGASSGVQMLLQAAISNPNVGVLIPIPQYPLYTATVGLCNGVSVPYYLDEESGWTISAKQVKQAVTKARGNGIDVRVLCIINPGNPTGNVLARKDMEDLIRLCMDEKLVIMADEVYQSNVYDWHVKPWISFKKVVMEMGISESEIEMVSFHSISKGMIGECGRRGGYFELFGIDASVRDQIYKLASISLCPNISGQIAVDVMVNPPKPGTESYSLYQTEMAYLYESLKRRAHKLKEALNQLQGVHCQPAEGAMYLHPSIELPSKALAKAAELNQSPDTFYCLALLNATGVCTVPGIGFLQKPGTYHFRCTFLPPEDELDEFIEKVKNFHVQFMDQYR